jgi:hypothetical protein
MQVYWLEQAVNDVPDNNNWLCTGELACLNRLRFAKRRADWRLGRWTAKRAVAARLGWPPYPPILADRNSAHAFRRPRCPYCSHGNTVGDLAQSPGGSRDVRCLIFGSQAGMRSGSR